MCTGGQLSLLALKATGAAVRTGPDGGYFGMEVLGDTLHLFGQEPLATDIQGHILPRREFHVHLPSPAAGAFLEALAAEGEAPVSFSRLAETFGAPQPPEALAGYLERLGLAGAFHCWDAPW